jgi:hypothetical protein
LALIGLAGCASVGERTLYTEKEERAAVVDGIPEARFWSDDPNIVKASHRAPGAPKAPQVLALSGGGADGAYGAGVLNGWSEQGSRPHFDVVTGVSAGALIAPLAFLGKSHDPVLKAVFTDGEAEGLLQSDGLAGLFGPGLYKPEPLQRLVAKYVDADLLRAVAAEHARGRRLFIVTTNVDSQRTAIWNMGAIAASGHPRALDLFRKVLVASASIPGVFAPVLIDVRAGNRQFAEMHVDGGVTANILVLPESFLVSKTALLPAGVKPKVHVILNGKLAPELDLVKASTVPVAVRSFQTTVKANTKNALIATYEYTQKMGWDFRITAIEPSYPAATSVGFETAYMRKLYEHGYSRGRASSGGWDATLPNLLASNAPVAR